MCGLWKKIREVETNKMTRTDWKRSHKRFGRAKKRRQKTLLFKGQPMNRHPAEIQTRRENKEKK